MQGDADNRPLSRGSSEFITFHINGRIQQGARRRQRRFRARIKEGWRVGKKKSRRAAAWLGFEAVPRCRLRVDQGLGSLVGLLQADVTGKQSGEDERSHRARHARRRTARNMIRGVEEGQ